MKITKSLKKCPSFAVNFKRNTRSFTVIPRHKLLEEMCVNGYVRNICKGKEFDKL